MSENDLFAYDPGAQIFRKVEVYNDGGSTTYSGPLKVSSARPTGSTQIVKYNTAENGSVIVHTVTAAKTFYLCSAFYSVFNGAAGDRVGYIAVRNAGDTWQYHLLIASCASQDGKVISQTYDPPLEITADYDVYVYSGLADLVSYGVIHGYEM